MLNKAEKYLRIKRLIITLVILLAITGIMIGIYYGLGLHKKFNDDDTLTEQIRSYGTFSYVVYVFIHFIQSTLIPISNIPTIMVGVHIFGVLEATILTIIGVLLGSVVSFALGKLFGKKAVYWILGQDTVEKYLNMANGKEKYLIFTMLLLPGFPDDIICIIAGITSMSWRFFLVSILITRTIPIYMIAKLGNVIPYNFWGIVILIALFIFVLIIGKLVLTKWNNVNKYIDKFEEKIKKSNNKNM